MSKKNPYAPREPQNASASEETASDAQEVVETPEEATTDHDEASPVDPDDFKKEELVAMAEDKGVSTSGTKAEIAERLNEASASE